MIHEVISSPHVYSATSPYLAFGREFCCQFLCSQFHWGSEVWLRHAWYCPSIFIFVDRLSFLACWLAARQQYGNFLKLCVTINNSCEQVFVPYNDCFHDDIGSSTCRNLLCFAIEWFNLHLGSWKCWSQICTLFWFHCGLVVLHSLDDLYRRKLPGKGLFPGD